MTSDGMKLGKDTAQRTELSQHLKTLFHKLSDVTHAYDDTITSERWQQC